MIAEKKDKETIVCIIHLLYVVLFRHHSKIRQASCTLQCLPFVYFLYVHPYLKRSFFRTFFLKVFFCGGRLLNQLSKQTHFTSKYVVTLKTNAFSVSGNHVLCWRWKLLVLGTNVLSAGDKWIENTRLNFSHTHAQLPIPVSYKQNLCRDDC